MPDFAIAAVAPPTLGETVPKPKNVAEAAQQFEALLLTQLLENTRPQGEPDDSVSETTWSLAAQQFAQVLSRNGGFGLAKLIAARLEGKHP